MTTKVTVHSNVKRLVQIVGIALFMAISLTGLKRFSTWWKAEQSPPLEHSAALPTPTANLTQGDLIIGRSIVVDADTIDVQGRRVRLEGIDAPEVSQDCGRTNQEWPCGQHAKSALGAWLDDRVVTCVQSGEDRYGRTLGRCFVEQEDVQSWLVINGWALAYREHSTDFVAAEEIAKANKVGVWQGDFLAPWDWRAQRRKGVAE